MTASLDLSVLDAPSLVTGAGGFIGSHMVRDLLNRGASVTAVDSRPLDSWSQIDPRAHNQVLDLRGIEACRRAVEGSEVVYNFASDMGGMGFIEHNKALCMLSTLINTHLLLAARDGGVKRYVFASSACVYAADKQLSPDAVGLAETDAYPAMPEDGYGWEKLFGERMCRHFREDFSLLTQVPRYHNIYGPLGTFEGGREKAPAAICRKVAAAVLDGAREIEIWGDGKQTRSFTYIDDCITGTELLLVSGFAEPLNIGSAQLVSINQLVDIVEEIAGVRLSRQYVLDAPKGVRGRNSDNTLVREVLGWEPSIRLQDGLERTYRWIYDELSARSASRPTSGDPLAAHHSQSADGRADELSVRAAKAS